MTKDNVLVIGAGGREHALAAALARSQGVERVYCAPGNDGMSDVATVLPVNMNDHGAIMGLINEYQIRLSVVGPEAPLVAGLSDYLRKQGALVVGASQKASLLEGSKLFAKDFMAKYSIPTAEHRSFTSAKEAKSFVRSPEAKKFRVLKADGLAAGKGVFVVDQATDLEPIIADVMEKKKFGPAGDKILIEEILSGPEISVIALTDGNTVLPLPASQDHKRAFDNNRGPNTGGMGAYAPTPFYTDSLRTLIQKNIFDNFLRGLRMEKLDFRGFIYFGLMLTQQGPKVLEFNVRFGDPEAQAVLPLIDHDFYNALLAVAQGELATVNIKKRPMAACTVVLASQGYPDAFEKGFAIEGLDEARGKEGVLVFHAGTKKTNHGFATNGGRVLTVTGMGKNLEMAVVRAYQGVKKISFKNMRFRKDIAAQALKNKNILKRIKAALQ